MIRFGCGRRSKNPWIIFNFPNTIFAYITVATKTKCESTKNE